MSSDALRKECEELLGKLRTCTIKSPYTYVLPTKEKATVEWDVDGLAEIEAFALRMKQEALREAADAMRMRFPHSHMVYTKWLRARAEEVSR